MSDSKDHLQLGETYPKPEVLEGILKAFIDGAQISGKAVDRLLMIPTNGNIKTPLAMYDEVREALQEGFSGKSRIHEYHGVHAVEFVAAEIRPEGERRISDNVITFVQERVDLTGVLGKSLLDKEPVVRDSEVFEPESSPDTNN
jgi:hypothetical protein